MPTATESRATDTMSNASEESPGNSICNEDTAQDSMSNASDDIAADSMMSNTSEDTGPNSSEEVEPSAVLAETVSAAIRAARGEMGGEAAKKHRISDEQLGVPEASRGRLSTTVSRNDSQDTEAEAAAALVAAQKEVVEAPTAVMMEAAM